MGTLLESHCCVTNVGDTSLISVIVASFNAQSVKGKEMACRRCDISTVIKENGVDLLLSLKHGLVLNVTKRKLLN